MSIDTEPSSPQGSWLVPPHVPTDNACRLIGTTNMESAKEETSPLEFISDRAVKGPWRTGGSDPWRQSTRLDVLEWPLPGVKH